MQFRASFAVKAAGLVLCATQSAAANSEEKRPCMVYLYKPDGSYISNIHYILNTQTRPDVIPTRIWNENLGKAETYRAEIYSNCFLQKLGIWPEGWDIASFPM